MTNMRSDALALEYQRYYGTARGNLNVANLVNNPAANCKCSVFGLGLAEQLWNGRLGKLSPLFQDSSNAPVIAANVVEHLPNILLLKPDVLVGHIEADAVKHER